MSVKLNSTLYYEFDPWYNLLWDVTEDSTWVDLTCSCTLSLDIYMIYIVYFEMSYICETPVFLKISV